jgi:hypothetical protein
MNSKLITKLIPVIIVIIVIAGVIFLMLRNGQSSTVNNDSISNIQTDVEKIKILPIESLTELKLADSKITFNSAYFINTLAQGRDFEVVTCGTNDQQSCVLAFVTDGVDTYYISTPFEPIASNSVTVEPIAKSFNYKDSELFFKNNIIESFNEDGTKVEGSDMTAQMYGCLNTKICIGSGLIELTNKESNNAKTSKFIDFVNSINIE